MDPFDVVFCDTCIGGSTVASALARSARGLRAFYLADYTVNPLGKKCDRDVRLALERWVDIAADRAGTLLVACNTASVRLADSPEAVSRAAPPGLRVYSMVDLLDRLLLEEAGKVTDQCVCLMGTEYTVSRPIYEERLKKAGAAGTLPLPAPQTERIVAHLQHVTPQGVATIRDEIGNGLAGADAVLLACTCFPLIADLIEDLRPGIHLLDPARAVGQIAAWPEREGPNRLTLAVSGDAVTLADVRESVEVLFAGWDEIEVVSFQP